RAGRVRLVHGVPRRGRGVLVPRRRRPGRGARRAYRRGPGPARRARPGAAGVPGRRCRPMWILYARPRPRRPRPARPRPRPERPGHPRGARRQPLPVYRVREHRGGGQAGGPLMIVIEHCAVATVDAVGTEYADGHIVVDGDRITAVGPGPAPLYA